MDSETGLAVVLTVVVVTGTAGVTDVGEAEVAGTVVDTVVVVTALLDELAVVTGTGTGVATPVGPDDEVDCELTELKP